MWIYNGNVIIELNFPTKPQRNYLQEHYKKAIRLTTLRPQQILEHIFINNPTNHPINHNSSEVWKCAGNSYQKGVLIKWATNKLEWLSRILISFRLATRAPITLGIVSGWPAQCYSQSLLCTGVMIIKRASMEISEVSSQLKHSSSSYLMSHSRGNLLSSYNRGGFWPPARRAA